MAMMASPMAKVNWILRMYELGFLVAYAYY